MKTLNTFQLTVTLLAALHCGACGQEAAADGARRNVILICMDTVRADHLGAYGYDKHETTPGLDALSARSLLFKDTSANAGWTKPSVPSYMTGLYPAQHGVYEGHSHDAVGEHSDVLPSSAVTIAEVFQGAGYRTAAFVRNAQIRTGQGIEQGFDTYMDGAGDAKDIRWRALDWLDQRDASRPYFLYLHLLDAHWPYPVPDEYGGLFSSSEAIAFFRTSQWQEQRERINSGDLVLSDAQRETLIALYDGALRYIDDQLMLLMQGLEQRGLSDNTVICIIADHGEEFLEHGKVGHGNGLHEELLQVPWILHIPGLAAEQIETPVSLVDLFPTLLHAADLSREIECEGVDRLAFPHLWRDSFAEHKGGRLYQQSIRRGQLKLIRQMESTGTPTVKVTPPTIEEIVESGARLSVSLRHTPEEGLLAGKIQVRGTSDDPMEIKGVIEAMNEEGIVLSGIAIPLLKDVVVYGITQDAMDADRSLVVGAGVKVKIRSAGDGFVGYRVKLYAADAGIESEVRGVPSRVEFAEEGIYLHLGPLRVAMDDATVVDMGATRDHSLTREELCEFLMAGGASWKPFAAEVELYDLDRGGGEHELLDSPSETAVLSGALDEFGVRLTGKPLWSARDRKALTPKDLRELSAIGYVGDED